LGSAQALESRYGQQSGDFFHLTSQASRRTMKELVEAIAKALVDYPDQVQVRAIEGKEVTIFELRVAPSDFGNNRPARAHSRCDAGILNAIGATLRRRFVLEILD
jgi:hypothetical protein